MPVTYGGASGTYGGLGGSFFSTGLFGDGSASNPSIAFASDFDGTGTGFYRPLANQIAATISGTQTHTWTSSSYTNTSANAQIALGPSADAIMAYATSNSLRFGTTAGSTATSRTEMNKVVTAIADNAATTTFTVTIPNAAHSAVLKIVLKGSLGAGGAIGANENSKTTEYDIDISRTPGVNAAAVAGVAFGGGAGAPVAGAATMTITAAVSAIAGAVGVTNTFTVNVTIARGSGSSTNHTCFVYGVLLNDNATGITLA